MSFKKNRKSRMYEAQEGYDLFADGYDESLGYLNSFEEGFVFAMFRDLRGLKVLDVGCGTGRLVGELMRFGGEVTAVDVSEKMVGKVAKKYSGVEAIVADVQDLPFEDESFDAVFAMFLIVHLKDLRKAFDEIYRVLKPGGFLVVSNINQRKPPKLKGKDGEEIIIKSYYHIPKHVIKALEESFFTIEREEFVYENKSWINQIIKAVKS